MNKKLSLSNFRKNAYLQLFLIFGDQNQLNKYLNIFFKYHHLCRARDTYLSYREGLFHANWIGMNNGLCDHLDHIYSQAISNLQLSGQVEEEANQWNQIAKYECEVFLYDLTLMYKQNRDLEEFGFHIEKLVSVLFSNFDEGSYIHISTLNKYMGHPIYGNLIRSKLSIINLDLWKVRCLGQFDDVVIEFIYALKVQYISAMNNSDKEQVRQNVNCIRIYMSVLKYNTQVSYRLVVFIQYLSRLSNNIWQQDFIIQSGKWIPAIKRIYQYKHSFDEAFSELFLNDNEQFYFKYPSQLLNYKVHPFRLIQMRFYFKMFKIFCAYRNQIVILRVINTYIYLVFCSLAYFTKKFIKLPWIKIIICLIVMWFGFKYFKAQSS